MKRSLISRMMLTSPLFAACAVLAAGCGQAMPEDEAIEDIGVELDAMGGKGDHDKNDDRCRDRKGKDRDRLSKVCFELDDLDFDNHYAPGKRDKNGHVTHVFLEVLEKCGRDRKDRDDRDKHDGHDDRDDFEIEKVEVGGKKVKLHEKGGPCKEIDRDVWFPINKHDEDEKICVFTEGRAAKKLRIGVKEGGKCEEEKEFFKCRKCDDKDRRDRDHDDRHLAPLESSESAPEQMWQEIDI